MLCDRRVHDLLVDHAQGVLLLDLIDDPIVCAYRAPPFLLAVLFILLERLLVQILVLEVLHHVRIHVAAAPAREAALLLRALLLLLSLLLREPDLLSNDLLLDLVLRGRARRPHAHIGGRGGASCCGFFIERGRLILNITTRIAEHLLSL